MDTATIDVPAYLARIGYDGPTAPTLDVLAALQRHHVDAVPFETLAMILGEPVEIALPALQQKILREGRGGYCFELNLLFLALLRALGFEAHGLTGRVVMNAPADTTPARTHVTLLVTVDGVRHIVDVGFGGMTPTAPLRLDIEDGQPTPNEPYRLLLNDGTYTLRAHVDGEWRAYYLFDLARPADIDFEVGNWYVSTHPRSPFRGRLIAARSRPGERHTLRGGDYAVHRVGQESERHRLDDPDAVITLLKTVFGVRVPDHPRLRASLAEALSLAAAADGARPPDRDPRLRPREAPEGTDLPPG